MDWLTDNKIPVGKWIEAAVDFFYAHFAWFFDGITVAFEFVIEGTADVLGFLNPLVLILLIAALAYWLQRSWKLLVFLVPALLLIVNLGYWEDTILTISLVTWRRYSAWSSVFQSELRRHTDRGFGSFFGPSWT